MSRLYEGQGQGTSLRCDQGEVRCTSSFFFGENGERRGLGNELPIPEGLRGCSRRVVVDTRGMGFGGGGVSLSLKAAIGLKGLMLKEDEN